MTRRLSRRRAALAATVGLAASGSALALADPDRPLPPRASALTADDLAGIPASDRAITLASERWLALTKPPVASLRPLSSAHPGRNTIRVNRTRAQLTGPRGRQRFPYSRKSVVVKTGRVGETVTLVAIMRKVSAGNAVGSWRYVEYTRSGAGSRFTKVGGGQSLCTGCHTLASQTQGSDFVFTRLR